ncbi:MAG TPA: LacI family DNA-binding transcriptional regulator [Thermoanaerobaculia bacterium]|nr:LacI family DNA-binding transcriptional regulator [Thermoanaerobaculia bacterium]
MARQHEPLRYRRRRGAAVTIHDVAARAGVSVATVSRVLNGKELVREETSRQVLEVAKSLRYVPNVAARTLSIRRSQTIGIVLPEVHGEFFSEVIRGIDLAARAAGYHILVSGSHSDANEMIDVLDAMRGRVDGLVVMAPDLTLTTFREQLSHKLPMVLLNSDDERHPTITIDNYGGARTMMKHLASLGHKRIAFIKGPEQNADARERLRGYRQVMRALGGASRELEFDGDFTERAGYDAVKPIVALSPRPTAIFAANDSMAVGALSAFAESGIDIPREMSLAGFDDIPIAHYVNPPLTTIGVDIAELGRRAFAALADAMEKGSNTRREECIGTTLVVRKSCAVSNSGTYKTRGRKKGEGS